VEEQYGDWLEVLGLQFLAAGKSYERCTTANTSDSHVDPEPTFALLSWQLRDPFVEMLACCSLDRLSRVISSVHIAAGGTV
jgi:hypothetical protein